MAVTARGVSGGGSNGRRAVSVSVRRNGSGEEGPDSGSRSSAKKLKKKIKGKGEEEGAAGEKGPGWAGSVASGLVRFTGRPSGCLSPFFVLVPFLFVFCFASNLLYFKSK
jgi:hypothetical protein